jgi:Fic family protein
MKHPLFKHTDLRLFNPEFGSKLTDSIIELEHLRKRKLSGSTHPHLFFQLKNIFHTLESIASARIEGNNTTIAEYIDLKIVESKSVTPSIQEIMNIEKATDFVEQYVKTNPISQALIRELHKQVVADLDPPPNGEGDATPGEYRKKNVTISKSEHLPPDMSAVPGYMEELFAFINNNDGQKYDLLKTAIAHHRFVWIHPFANGNGRVVRLFTYALLVKNGFSVDVGRILNPTAVFCADRDEYYRHLSFADTGTEKGILDWCEYVLLGLRSEIEKIDRLLDYPYLKKMILMPALVHALDRKLINETESKVLRRACETQLIQASDLKDIYAGKHSAEISRQIRKLIEKKMLIPEKEGTRKYLLNFSNSYLLRSIVTMLGDKGFLPIKD